MGSMVIEAKQGSEAESPGGLLFTPERTRRGTAVRGRCSGTWR
jgi:hypothetical protein